MSQTNTQQKIQTGNTNEKNTTRNIQLGKYKSDIQIEKYKPDTTTRIKYNSGNINREIQIEKLNSYFFLNENQKIQTR